MCLSILSISRMVTNGGDKVTDCPNFRFPVIRSGNIAEGRSTVNRSYGVRNVSVAYVFGKTISNAVLPAAEDRRANGNNGNR